MAAIVCIRTNTLSDQSKTHDVLLSADGETFVINAVDWPAAVRIVEAITRGSINVDEGTPLHY